MINHSPQGATSKSWMMDWIKGAVVGFYFSLIAQMVAFTLLQFRRKCLVMTTTSRQGMIE